MTDVQRHVVARRIVDAYLRRNDVPPAEVKGLFESVVDALDRLPGSGADMGRIPDGGTGPNPFSAWLARNRLTVREAARLLGCSTAGVQVWKLKRPPLQVLLA